MIYVELHLGEPPMSGNKLMRLHWAARRQYERQWRSKMILAAHGQTWPPPINDQIRRVEIHWYAPKPPDQDNALHALKGTVVDHLKRNGRRRIGGRMMTIPGVVPILWDDDPKHCDLVYLPCVNKTRSLVIVVTTEE